MRIIPQIDRDPRFVALAQTPAGKAVALAVFAALLVPRRLPSFFEILVVLGLMTLLPSHRRALLSLGVVYWVVAHPKLGEYLTRLVAKQEGLGTLNAALVYRVVLLVTLALFTVGLRIVFRGGSSLPVRRPLLTLYLFHMALLLCASLAPLSGLWRVLAWTLVSVVSLYVWYFSYALLDRNSPDRDPVRLQVGTFLPFWAAFYRSGSTPYVKGAAYLRKIEAKSPEDLAVCQLKAIKLLAWSLVLMVTQQFFDWFVHGGDTPRVVGLAAGLWGLGSFGPLPHFSVPSFEQALGASVLGQPFAWYTCWASLVAAFLSNVVEVASAGGFLVAICRMSGFRALRNTCRPLQAQTVADFWNRFSYYYKEMLVDCFFYPTFVRYFKRHPRLRVIAATFAAAGLGNILAEFFHNSPGRIIEFGFWKALLSFRVFLFQALVLSTGIAVSQLRGRRRSPDRSTVFAGRVMSAVGVGLFYCLLSAFDNPERAYGLGDHFRFLFHLFAIV
jgi:hypothetical protein